MFIDRCRLVRETLDNPAITTDIIVGFPGETDADFEATCRVSRECGFSKIHIFPFSARKGTPAAEMADKVAPEVKAERCARLAALERRAAGEVFPVADWPAADGARRGAAGQKHGSFSGHRLPICAG